MATSPTEDSKRISANVNAALRDAGIAQRKVADDTGIPITTLGRKLTGKASFSIDDLAKLAAVLEVSIAALITYTPDPERVAS